MGYIIPVLREKFKTSKIIVLHIENFPLPDGCLQSEISALCSTETIEIQKFLETQILNISMENIHIIEWRPSLNFYKDTYVKLLSLVVDFIKRTDAGNRTTAAFGRRWIKNFFKNIKNIKQALLYRQTDLPVIVTGSGTSLEQAMPVIRNVQENHIIIAASSSVLALSAGGIKADIIIAADGGNWALRHIYAARRLLTTAFGVNLCAALPSQCADTPQLIINDGSFWQSIALHELALPSVIIQQRGTVTAASLELAMILSSGNIYLAGMDFSVNDIRTHTKPYAFDSLFFEHSNRFNPFYSELFFRSSLIKKGGSMDIYAAWFKEQLLMWPKRIYSIGEHKIFESSLPRKFTINKKEREFLKPVHAGKNPALGTDALLNAINDSTYTNTVVNELTQLLFPDKKEVTKQELETAVREVSYG